MHRTAALVHHLIPSTTLAHCLAPAAALAGPNAALTCLMITLTHHLIHNDTALRPCVLPRPLLPSCSPLPPLYTPSPPSRRPCTPRRHPHVPSHAHRHLIAS
ncbi:hypothetical protein DENSPDRAFT_887264 [Dentipellis sp. KUC8613]|nr:hypothetical protein DENSPDRAFT_887264 [Dentipellis sp. KUC8613]